MGIVFRYSIVRYRAAPQWLSVSSAAPTIWDNISFLLASVLSISSIQMNIGSRKRQPLGEHEQRNATIPYLSFVEPEPVWLRLSPDEQATRPILQLLRFQILQLLNFTAQLFSELATILRSYLPATGDDYHGAASASRRNLDLDRGD